MQAAVSGILGEMSGPICFVVGARPNFMKVAPVLRALDAPALLVHTEQHYDPEMSEVFLRDLGLPEPDVFLGVGSGAYGFTILKVADFSYMQGRAANAVAHNTFLSVLVELGVVGAALLLALLASMLYCAIRMRYLERCLWISLLLTWMIGVSALTWEYHKPTWLLFGLLTAHVYSRPATKQIAHRS